MRVNNRRWAALAAVWALAAGALTPGAARAQGAGSPAAVFHFDEGAGGVAADASGQGVGAVLAGGAAWGPGLVGAHALHLPGQGADAEAPKALIDTTQNYTVMAWVRVSDVKGYQTFVSIDGENVSGFFLQLRADTGQFAFTVLPGDATTGQGAIAGATDDPDPNRWYHLAGVYDAGAHTIALYVNGVKQQTVPAPAATWKANGHTAIGRGRFGGRPVDFVNGDLDDVRFYQSALGAADIAAIARANLPAGAPATVAAPTLAINAARPGVKVRPMLYGLMTEEINYSYDGGLYGELIRNRTFKDSDKEPSHWSSVQTGGGAGIYLDTTQPNVGSGAALTTCLRLNVQDAPAGSHVGVANDGFWGIPVRPNTKYRASFYAKSDGGVAPLNVSIESSDGATVYARAIVPKITTEWRSYTVTLATGRVAPTSDARFVIAASRPGTVWLNLVSLFPPTFNNRPNGNRIDLMQRLAVMKPAFLRMPGGNYLEGDTIETRFDWKKTLGPISRRPGHMGTWGYRSSDGMGLLEFLEWCEDLKMEPVLAVYAGYSLRGQHVDPGPALQPFVQDALDEIEYVTGGVHTKWGAVRAANGHPKPWALHYVEIGNEDWFDRSGSYDGRYAQFFDAVKAKYPKLQLIATAGVKLRTPDVIDEHYYRSPAQFVRDTRHYDGYDRKGPKIFVGEWASQEGEPTPNLNSALGDAAWMTGMERNSDVVVLESYAPLFTNVNPGGHQWHTNLIGYDALSSFGSPAYWAQAMFSRFHGDVVLPATLAGSRGLSQSVTRDTKTGTVYVKLVNATGMPQAMRVTLAGVKKVSPRGAALVLSGTSPRDTNSISEPNRIVPRTLQVNGLSPDFRFQFAPYSVTILQIGTK